MPVLTVREIYDIARAAGFGEHEAVTWTAIALAESGGRTDAVDDRGSRSVGLWQISAPVAGQPDQWGRLDDPAANARAAFELSRHGTDMRPWTVTHAANAGTAADYRTHLAEVEQLIGIRGDPRGVAGSRAPLPPPMGNRSTVGSYDQIDAGAGLGSTSLWTSSGAVRVNQALPADADGDGLTDVFERLTGADPNRSDTDGDGLADGFEAYVSGSDPLAVDSDRDGTTDGFEVAQHTDPLTSSGGAATARWTIGAAYQRRLAAGQAQAATPQSQPVAAATVSGTGPGATATNQQPPAVPAVDLNGGRVSASGAEPRLVASLDAAGHGNWQGAVKSGNHWFLAQAGAGDKFQIFHRLDGSGKALDQMKVVGAAHTTSFAVVGDTVYATNDGEVVTFPYQPGATIDASDSTPTGWKGYISIDPTQRFAVIRKGNHYRAYDLATREPIGREVVTPTGQRQGFSIVGDTLYVLTGKTNAPGRVDSFSFTTGQQTGTQDITGVGPGRHREPEGMFGDLMGVKTGLGNDRRLKIYQLDTGVAAATEQPVATVAPGTAPGPTSVADTNPAAAAPGDDDPPPGGPGDRGDDDDHVKFGGETVDRRTSRMLTEAERLANLEDPSIGKFDLTQGSFSHSVGASAGTHDGPGAFDMYTKSYSDSQKKIIGLALRKVGFASWLRRESQGPWDEHWHGIAIGTKGLPSVAAGQVKSYLSGGTGLARGGQDTDPRPDEILTWEQYQQEHASIADQPPSGLQETPPAGQSGDRFAVGGGQPLDPGRDTDLDGLTDAFEQLAGTSPTAADTDRDGLLDAYEVTTSRTDPWKIDSDFDGFTDAAELRFGSDPLGTGQLGAGALGSGDVGAGAIGSGVGGGDWPPGGIVAPGSSPLDRQHVGDELLDP